MVRNWIGFSLGFLLLSTTASAQPPDSILWFDVRSSANAVENISTPVYPWTLGQFCGEPAFNGGGAGDGQILRVSPRFSNTNLFQINAFPNFDADDDLSTAMLWLYMTVNDTPGVDDKITRISLDFEIQLGPQGTGGRNRIQSMDFQFLNDSTVFDPMSPPALPPPWASIQQGHIVPGDPPQWINAEATVNDPANPEPEHGLLPGATYRLGRLRIIGDTFTGPCGPALASNSIYRVRAVVGTNGIQRSVRPTVSDPYVVQSEQLAMGYVGGAPESPNVDGGASGAKSIVPDAEIHIRMKWDVNGDGRVDARDDVPEFYLTPGCRCCAPGLNNQQCTYVYDGAGTRELTALDLGISVNRMGLYQSAPWCPGPPQTRFVRVSQEATAGMGDYTDLGCVETFWHYTSATPEGFYQYSGGSYGGPQAPSFPDAPNLIAQRSHMLFVPTDQGLAMFAIHGEPASVNAGNAETTYHVSCHSDGARIRVFDDPSPQDSYPGPVCGPMFTAQHSWNNGTDGLVLSPVEESWEVVTEFTAPPTGLNDWIVLTQPFAAPRVDIPLTLASGLRVRLDPCCCCTGDMNGDDMVSLLDNDRFVDCVLGVACGECACADFDGNGVIDALDIAGFTDRLTMPPPECVAGTCG